MMAMRILLALVLALAAGLTALWLGPDAKPRDHSWVPPAPLAPEITAPSAPAGLDARAPAGAGAYFAILDRPMFAPDRRPPPPPDAKPAEPVVDPLADTRLVGILSGEGLSAILVTQAGKTRRIRVSENLGSWTLSEVKGREAVLKNGEQTRTLVLVAKKDPVAPVAVAPPGGVAQPAGAAAAVPAEDTVARDNQRREEARRENIRKRNELRATAGLPPVFD